MKKNIRRKESDFEDRIKRLEDHSNQRIGNSQTELKRKIEQAQVAEARSERAEHDIAVREMSIRAKEKELTDRLKRQEEIET